MRAIIIGSSRGQTRLSAEHSYPSYLVKIPNKDASLLDWTLNELKKINIQDTIFIAGYHVEKIIKNYPGLKIFYNDDWENNNSLNLLSLVSNFLDQDVIIINSNVLFRANLINKSLLINSSFIISNDKKFNLDKSIFFFKKVDLNILKKNILKKKFLKFSDLNNIYSSKNNTFKKIIDNENFSLFENYDALAKFILGTKAQTLNRLQSLINKANILNQITVDYSTWNKKKSSLIKEIATTFKNEKIVIRSSAISEDSWKKSNAGSYKSFLNVDPNNFENVRNKINEVFNSYKKLNSQNIKDEVLIQKYLQNTKSSGVLFTISNENGAPYYIINYDDTSGITDTVTSGTSSDTKTIYVYKNFTSKTIKWLYDLLKVVKEIEKKVLHSKLDIEFAVDKKGNIFILQVRPLVISKKLKFYSMLDFDDEIYSIKNFLVNKLNYKDNISGIKTFYSNMTDWNPVEMIGTQPKPLDYSLYCKLITNNSWAEARKQMGYKDMTNKRLLVSLAGKPYVDIRRCFNSFLLQSVDSSLSNKLINQEIKYLDKNPAQFDKVEFNVVVNCYYFDKERMSNHLIKNLKINKINSNKIIKLYSSWTRDLIANSNKNFKGIENNYLILNKELKNINFSKNSSIFELSFKLNQIVDLCIKKGVVPFSIQARCAFIALQILSSFEKQNIFSSTDYNNFLKNISTISSEFNEDLHRFLRKKISKKYFIDKYGHLRPSTYDITSKNYKQMIDENFFKEDNLSYNSSKSSSSISKKIWKKNSKKIINLLKYEKIKLDESELYQFIVNSIKGREKGKYEFTKCVNKILEIIKIFSNKLNLSKEDIQFYSIEDFLNFENTNFNNFSFFKTKLNNSKKKYHLESLIKAPALIRNINDIFEIKQFSITPNFITRKKIQSEILLIKNYKNIKDISKKIILIETADPGYDWLFSYDIAGLITKFGGAASHMAIRASEYGIPSVIGCGENLFNQISGYSKVLVDCDQKTIRKLI